MNRSCKSLFAVCVVLAVSGHGAQHGAPPEESGDDDRPPPITGAGLLQAVTARLPGDSLRIHGDIAVRRRRGVVIKRLTFHALLDLGGTPALAQYSIMDAFGRDLERLTVVRRPGSNPHLTYAAGDPLETQPAPSMSAAIQRTDIHWMDLTLSFLWWPGGVLTGTETIRGRPCHIVEVGNPHAGAGTGDQASYCAAARLWIDERLLMLLQAELLDANRRPIRRLWVDSFKKIDNRWMIKDMEVEAEPATHRTKLTIREALAGPPS